MAEQVPQVPSPGAPMPANSGNTPAGFVDCNAPGTPPSTLPTGGPDVSSGANATIPTPAP